jgi:uncharacterized membrane protein YkgB
MTDAISLALSTGLGPVVAIIIILTMMGLTYKIVGRTPSIVTGIASIFALMFLDFIPVYWGLTIVFALIAGMVLSGGELNGD